MNHDFIEERIADPQNGRVSGEIIHFVPRPELDARGNLRGFIDSCRHELTVFGANLDWESNTWDVTKYLPARGRKGRLAFVFSNLDTAGKRGKVTPMTQPFLDFAKASMRYHHALAPTRDFNKRLAALRVLEKTLIALSTDGVPRVEKTDSQVLNHATQLILEKYPGSAYFIANRLEYFAGFLVKNQLTAIHFEWKNPIPKPDDANIQIGKRAEERRKKKLPTEYVINALAMAFDAATETVDVLPTSVAALMMCSPDRINEVFRLPVNCEHETTYEGKVRYGLRWWPSKGMHPMVKWVVATMVPTAREAIRRLREHTEEARRIARWYEQNPGRLFLPTDCEHLRDQRYLTTADLCDLVGFPNTKAANKWALRHGLVPLTPVYQGPSRPLNEYSFEEVERVIVDMLPERFPLLDPATRLKYSDSLVLILKNQFHPGRFAYRCMFDIVTTDAFNNQLGCGSIHGKSSVFSRLGVLDEDGEPIKITSHQFRHLLNTLAQHNCVDQLTIALWSGRRDVSQNANYNHVSPEEIVDRYTEIFKNSEEEFTPNVPITREEYYSKCYSTVHTTPYGFCTHRWTITPCEKARACLDCTEHICIKGDQNKTERIRQCLNDAEKQLMRDQQAIANGYCYADKWFHYNSQRVERLRQLVLIFDDPAIPEGQPIALTNDNEYSPVKLAINKRMLLGDPDAKALRKTLSLKGVTATALKGGTL